MAEHQHVQIQARAARLFGPMEPDADYVREKLTIALCCGERCRNGGEGGKCLASSSYAVARVEQVLRGLRADGLAIRSLVNAL